MKRWQGKKLHKKKYFEIFVVWKRAVNFSIVNLSVIGLLGLAVQNPIGANCSREKINHSIAKTEGLQPV